MDTNWALIAILLASQLSLQVAGTAAAAASPQPPCAVGPKLEYPPSVNRPAIQSQTVKHWVPPPCLGWDGSQPTLLVALAGRVRVPGGETALLDRFGAVSHLSGIRYWSVTDQAWKVLITRAFAVTNLAGDRPRRDFQAAEMLPGIPLYSVEDDSRSSKPVVYRMRVVARTPDRVVITVTNVSSVRLLLVTLFGPGELQATHFFERLSPDEWGYYGLWGVTTGLLTRGHPASSINRAVALYRYLAGIPTDEEPPVAPRE